MALVPCSNPNLPGVVADLTRPFGEWSPIAEDDKAVKVADLRKYAEKNDIDLGGATKKADIVAAIDTARSAEAEKDSPTAGDNPKE